MNSILIKPHHFIDIIKLYGSGIDRFVPDEKMGHDFYKVANEIIDNPSVDLREVAKARGARIIEIQEDAAHNVRKVLEELLNNN